MAEMVEVDGSGFGWRFGCGLCGLWVFGDGLGEALGPSWALLAPSWLLSGSFLVQIWLLFGCSSLLWRRRPPRNGAAA